MRNVLARIPFSLAASLTIIMSGIRHEKVCFALLLIGIFYKKNEDRQRNEHLLEPSMMPRSLLYCTNIGVY